MTEAIEGDAGEVASMVRWLRNPEHLCDECSLNAALPQAAHLLLCLQRTIRELDDERVRLVRAFQAKQQEIERLWPAIERARERIRELEELLRITANDLEEHGLVAEANIIRCSVSSAQESGDER